MYSKHKKESTIYQVIIDNKLAINFNTDKKRSTFIERVRNEGRRQVTCITNVIYPGRYNTLFNAE